MLARLCSANATCVRRLCGRQGSGSLSWGLGMSWDVVGMSWDVLRCLVFSISAGVTAAGGAAGAGPSAVSVSERLRQNACLKLESSLPAFWHLHLLVRNPEAIET